MTLTLDQIKSITLGAEIIKQESDGIHFYRFTEEQQALYKARSEKYYTFSFATSGIHLRFLTNSNSLYLKVFTIQASARSYFSFDIYVNSVFYSSLNNYDDNYEHPTFPRLAAPPR